MVLESTPFGDDVKRSSSPERVPQKVPDVVPTFSLGDTSAHGWDQRGNAGVEIRRVRKAIG